jgi:hypothetical protein
MFDEQKLISLKQNFTSQQFQWIKTDRPELIGKLVKCRDVQPTPDGRFMVFFDDGSKIDSTKLNSNLLMIMGETQPLSRVEIDSIYPQSKVRSTITQTPTVPISGPISIPPDLAPPVKADPPTPVTPPVQKSNMFVMFNSEPTEISIDLDVKLPEKKLLKMMYSGAEDKDKFVSELADYLLEMINKKAVTDSINKMLVVQPKKKPEVGVRLTQVQ